MLSLFVPMSPSTLLAVGGSDMSRENQSLALSLASLLLSGRLDLFHELSLEADGPVIGRAIDLFNLLRPTSCAGC